MTEIRKIELLELEQWGKMKRIDGEGADTMLAAELCSSSSDTRDATHVRVCAFKFKLLSLYTNILT